MRVFESIITAIGCCAIFVEIPRNPLEIFHHSLTPWMCGRYKVLFFFPLIFHLILFDLTWRPHLHRRRYGNNNTERETHCNKIPVLIVIYSLHILWLSDMRSEGFQTFTWQFTQELSDPRPDLIDITSIFFTATWVIYVSFQLISHQKKKFCYSFELFICIHVLSFIVDTLSLIPCTSCVSEQKPLNPLILMYFYLN